MFLSQGRPWNAVAVVVSPSHFFLFWHSNKVSGVLLWY